MLNIVIPMAGLGSRFSKAGYKNPKPLIDVHNVPMIKVVIDNLTPACPHRFIFICQQEHLINYELKSLLKKWAPDSIVIGINGVTEGAACTVLCAEEYINNSSSLMIANCDQFVDVNINDYLSQISIKLYDGLIMTMIANDPKWSFVGFDDTGKVSRVVEKQVISNEATVGIYNFKKGMDFVSAAKQMIDLDERVNGEFYVAPTYNKLIKDNLTIGIFNIGSERSGMYGLGIPEDLEFFISNPVSRKVHK